MRFITKLIKEITFLTSKIVVLSSVEDNTERNVRDMAYEDEITIKLLCVVFSGGFCISCVEY
jgi:hypothetical protein